MLRFRYLVLLLLIILILHQCDYVLAQLRVSGSGEISINTINMTPRVPLCNNLVVTPNNASVKVLIVSQLSNQALGCVSAGNPHKCIAAGTTEPTLTDFCSYNYGILPDASTLYSQVELGQISPIQKSSFIVDFKFSSSVIRMTLNVTLNLTDLSQWSPYIGGWGGGYSKTSCNSSQHAQLFLYSQGSIWGDTLFMKFNYRCSDNFEYYVCPGYANQGFSANIAANCTDAFGINGFLGYLGNNTNIPAGGRFYCGDYSTSAFGISRELRNKTYYCKPGSIVTGTHSKTGAIVDAFGLECSPINLNVAIVNLYLSQSGDTLNLTAENFLISKNVGNIDFLKISVLIPGISASRYWITLNNINVTTVLYRDIVRFGANVQFSPPLFTNNTRIDIKFDSGVNYSITSTSNINLPIITTTSTTTTSTSTTSTTSSTTFSSTIGAVPDTTSFSSIIISTTSTYSSTEPVDKSKESKSESDLLNTPNAIIIYAFIGTGALLLSSAIIFIAIWRQRSGKAREKFQLRSSTANSTPNYGTFQLSPVMIGSSHHNLLQASSGTHMSYNNMNANSFSPFSARNSQGYINSYMSDATTTQKFTQTIMPLYVPGYSSLVMNVDFIVPEQIRLGGGGTASIFSGTLINPILVHKHGTTDLAIKVFPKEDSVVLPLKANDQRSNFMYEVALMNLIPVHDNIVKLIGHMESPELAIIMKRYEGSVEALVRHKNITMEPALALKIASDIANGLNLIHTMNILHLDVKPHNMLWERTRDGSLNFCICDFGFASLVGESRKVISGLQIPKAVGITIRYAAPEVFMKLTLGSPEYGRANTESCKKIDVYAYGISMYFVLFGARHWPDLSESEIIDRIGKGARPNIGDIPALFREDKRSMAIISLIEQCWDSDPNVRPSFGTIAQKLQ